MLAILLPSGQLNEVVNLLLAFPLFVTKFRERKLHPKHNVTFFKSFPFETQRFQRAFPVKISPHTTTHAVINFPDCRHRSSIRPKQAKK